MNLTEMLTAAIKADSKRWNKDHTKSFFKSRLKKPLNDASAIAVLDRAGNQAGLKIVRINGIKFVCKAISDEAKKALNSFLYGKK